MGDFRTAFFEKHDRATGWDILEDTRPHVTGYKFIMPGVGLTGRDLPLSFVDSKWHVTQDELGHHYEATGDSDLECILSLIKQRIEGHECNEKCTR